MDDLELLQAFVSSYLSGRSTLLSNSDLRIEPISDTLQLLAKTEGLVATAKLSGQNRFTSIRFKSSFWPQLHEAMIAQKCLPIRQSKISGFYEYEPVELPDHYHVRFTDSLDLLQTWWSYKKSDKQLTLMSLLFLHRGMWYPIRDILCETGTLTIKTSGHEQQIYPLDMMVWLQKVAQKPSFPSPNGKHHNTQSNQHSAKADQYVSLHRRAVASHYPDSKRIGGYLMDAGLLSPAQVEVVLSDQELTGMRFGEILVSRGWLKSQTIEFLFQNVILPRRTLAKQAVEKARKEAVDHLKEVNASHQSQLQPSTSSPTSPIKPEIVAKKRERPRPLPKPTPQPAISSEPPAAQATPPQQASALSSAVPAPPSQVEKDDSPIQPPAVPRPPSIHDRETLATYDKLHLEDLPDWLEMDVQDSD